VLIKHAKPVVNKLNSFSFLYNFRFELEEIT